MKPLSSFDIYTIVNELQEILGRFIDKIYQISKRDILIKLRGKGKRFILIREGGFVLLTSKDFERPEKPSNFAMVLRKYLQGGRINSIKQHDFDRIVVFEIVKREEPYKLIAELFRNGNIVLVDKDGRIIMPLKEQEWSHRILKQKEVYLFPPKQCNPFELDKKGFEDILMRSDRDVVRCLAIDLSLGGTYAEEICLKSGVDKNKKARSLSKEETDRLYLALEEILDLFRCKKFSPRIITLDDGSKEIVPIKLEIHEKYKSEEKDSLLSALEALLEQEEKKEEVEIEKVRKNLERRLSQQIEGMKNLLKEAERKKREGDLLYIYCKDIQDLLDKARKVMKLKEKEEGLEGLRKMEKFHDIDLEKGILLVRVKDDGEERILKLNIRKSLGQNAEDIYELSKKLKEKAERAKIAIEKTKQELENLKVEREEKEEKKEKTWWFEKFRWCILSDGNLVIGGRDAKSNEIVVKKYMDDDDLFVHADIHGAPCCVLKSKDIDGKRIEITEKAKEEACEFAAVYSKAWKQFGEITSYWVYPHQVSKTPESGEYLPKGSFVVRGKRNYVRCKMEMGIGEVILKGVKKLMAGPVTAIEGRSDRYVILEPGERDKNEMAKHLSEKFNVKVEVVQKLLPPGNVSVVKTKGVHL